MNERYIELVIGSMLHDIGKLLYRYNDGRNHSVSGYDFLKEQSISNTAILNQVKYHHGKLLSKAGLPENDLAYITYWSDNVAAGADRRHNEDSEDWGYDKFMPLSSIFNILNGNNQDFTYKMDLIYDNGAPNEPEANVEQYSSEIYGQIVSRLREGLRAVELTKEYVNSLLSVLEATMSFVPSSTDKSQLCDISLYDHCKMTAAVAGCIYEFLQAQETEDYHTVLFKQGMKMYEENVFLLVSMDISGIQDFIYTVTSKNALKTLRSKSFYLEIMLEHIVDELLNRVGLARTNLIYSGGGHAYLLLANTERTKKILQETFDELKLWFLDNFKTELYIAAGKAACSADTLMNKPKGSYKDLFKRVGREVSQNKASRYSADEIIKLNSLQAEQYGRECRVCGALDHLTEDGLCPMCDAFVSLSSQILDKDFVSIVSEKSGDARACAKLPFDRYMLLENEEEVKVHIAEDKTYVRCYSKNRMFTGHNVATKLWTGDYHNGKTFQDMAEGAKGIKRIGVLRADVDNLGQAFVSGFERNGEDDYVGLSRSATFSRKMSIFFKLHLNFILRNGKFSVSDSVCGEPQRKAIVIYAGGDDLFLIGAWNEILEAAIDINDALERFTQGTLHISAGLGIFPEKYPVEALARQTGELEDCAKGIDGKNAVALFDGNNVYKWEVLKNAVIGEKYTLIKKYFDHNEEKGMAAMYKILAYLRGREDKINIARFAYLLGRMEPGKDESAEKKELYREFSRKMYYWMKDEEECRQLITAIYIYVYLNRGMKEEQNGSVDED